MSLTRVGGSLRSIFVDLAGMKVRTPLDLSQKKPLEIPELPRIIERWRLCRVISSAPVTTARWCNIATGQSSECANAHPPLFLLLLCPLVHTEMEQRTSLVYIRSGTVRGVSTDAAISRPPVDLPSYPGANRLAIR